MSSYYDLKDGLERIDKTKIKDITNMVYGAYGEPTTARNDFLDASLYPKIIMDHAWKTNYSKMYGKYYIEEVIFNPPATVVYWKDGSKTVVKCKADEAFDYEKGLAMAICKKLYGNGYNFHKVFKKWIPEVDNVVEKKAEKQPYNPYIDMAKDIRAALTSAFKEIDKQMADYCNAKIKKMKKGD